MGQMMRNDLPLQIDAQGLLSGCEYLPSPNCDDRPPGAIELLVIHNISLPPDVFGGDGVQRLFTNTLDSAAHPYYATIAGLKVSAHFFVRRDGQIVQFVPCLKRAWHAGESCWQGVSRCNDFSIGIELEGSDTVPYTDAQYCCAWPADLGAARSLSDTRHRRPQRHLSAAQDRPRTLFRLGALSCRIV